MPLWADFLIIAILVYFLNNKNLVPNELARRRREIFENSEEPNAISALKNMQPVTLDSQKILPAVDHAIWVSKKGPISKGLKKGSHFV